MSKMRSFIAWIWGLAGFPSRKGYSAMRQGLAFLNVSLVAAFVFQPTTTTDDLRSLLAPIREKYDLPALAGAIVTSHKLVATGAVGVRKYGTETPVTINDEFHLGSDTKAMTATLLALLVEEGKISWGTTLGESFPDLG